MKKIGLYTALICVLVPVSAAGVGDRTEDFAYLEAALAESYPMEDIAELAGIAAVVRNRMETTGYPSTAAGVVASFEGGAFQLPCAPIKESEKEEIPYRLAVDACEFVRMGADPTHGALNFCRLERKRQYDLRFDDSAEDYVSPPEQEIIEKSRVVIGDFAFW